MKKLTAKMLIILASLICFYACSDDDDSKKENITLKQSNLDSDIISVTWDEVSGAVYYTLQILKDNEPLNDATLIEKGDELKFDAEDLLANTKYTIKIKAGSSFTNEKIIAEGEIELTTKSLPAKLVGTWASKTSQKKYVLNADGTGSYTNSGTNKIKWKAEEIEEGKTSAKITMKVYSGNMYSTNQYVYKFEGDDLIISTETYQKEQAE